MSACMNFGKTCFHFVLSTMINNCISIWWHIYHLNWYAPVTLPTVALLTKTKFQLYAVGIDQL